MEFRDLKKQYQNIKGEIDEAILNVLNDSNYIMGKPVFELEEKLANYVGVKHCITCANGTDALQIALMTLGVSNGDAIFVPDFTFFSTGEVVPWTGATPVFVDIDKATYNISIKSLESSIQYIINNTMLRPRAIIAVDLFGQPADFLKIREIASKYNMYIIEDAAQGFGGRIGDKKACSFGDISTTSFFPAKPLGCYGDGGAIFTDNDEWAGLIHSYKVHGKGIDKYDNVRIGMNSRLDTIQAAVLLVKLKYFDYDISKCNQIADWYSNVLEGMVTVPKVNKGMYSSWAQYTICARDDIHRLNIINELKENDIPSSVYYRKPLHMQKAFENYIFCDISYENSTDVSGVCLSLPMHPYIQVEEIEQIAQIISRTIT